MSRFILGVDLSAHPEKLKNTVIVLSGASARQAFFYAKGFDLTEGFKILSGAVRWLKLPPFLSQSDVDFRYRWFAE
jgi:hypothetical protein